MIIIGFSGRGGSGKDTAASFIPDSTPLAFAKPLKDAVASVFGFSDEQLYGDLKEVVDADWNVTPRHVMQSMGTDYLKTTFGKEVFIECCRKSGTKIVVITDVRFDEEAEMVHSLGGVVARIDRSGVKMMTHASEQGISCHLVDYIISNDGTMEEFESSILQMYQLSRTKEHGEGN